MYEMMHERKEIIMKEGIKKKEMINEIKKMMNMSEYCDKDDEAGLLISIQGLFSLPGKKRMNRKKIDRWRKEERKGEKEF